jgi:hypothetical protein
MIQIFYYKYGFERECINSRIEGARACIFEIKKAFAKNADARVRRFILVKDIK